MKATHDWHDTTFGRVALFLGSIRFAVPVLSLVAVAMAWGTYLESMHDSRMSRATVYGAWWFVALMALIAVCLIFAVITRYPWQRRHVGFITVHFGLVLLIIGGFWSLFGRLEGYLMLEEGQTSNLLETEREVLEIAEFNAGQSTVLGTIDAPTSPGVVTVAGIDINVREYWDNSREEQYVAEGGPRERRAIEVAFGAGATQSEWVAEESGGEPPIFHGRLQIRLLPSGAEWVPPTGVAVESEYAFIVGSESYPVGDPGEEVFPGWSIVSVERFTHAMVNNGRLSESGGGRPNPAVVVSISDGDGTIERHTAFRNFPEMVLARTVEGAGASTARLAPTGNVGIGEQLVVFGSVGEMRIGYVGPDGDGRVLPGTFTAPAVIEVGEHTVNVRQELARAHVALRSVEAGRSSERRPVLVMEIPGAIEAEAVPFKSFKAVMADGRNLLLRYGPEIHELPFAFTLDDFRKMDYPGTEMAMAYESDVVVSLPDEEPFPFLVHMNTPFVHHPWKVYQSGFVGESVSIFSVMKDPGLPLTYFASIVLCTGIFLMFFSKRFSWGHPGIPNERPQSERETNVATHETRAPRDAAALPEPVGAGVGDEVLA